MLTRPSGKKSARLGVLAAPTRVVRIVVGPSFWSLDAGDLVTLTHSELPDLHGNRGLSECMAQVMEKRMAWGGGQCRVQLALLISDDTTIAGYAPSALVGSISGAVVTLDTTSPWGTNCFGRDTDANGAAYTSPLQGFAVGMRVQLSQLDDADKLAFLQDMGLDEPGLNRVIRAGYKLLDLITFFTIGPKEARAWTVRHGAKAPEAAGVIHTDFERGFIRAQTIAFDDFIAFKGEQGAKDAGKMRAEGKEYVVKDGDVLNFLFNV